MRLSFCVMSIRGKAQDHFEDALQHVYTIRQELLGLSETGRRTGVGTVIERKSSNWRTGIRIHPHRITLVPKVPS